jgi:hypothetical protein
MFTFIDYQNALIQLALLTTILISIIMPQMFLGFSFEKQIYSEIWFIEN